MNRRTRFWPRPWAASLVAATALAGAPLCQAARPVVVVEFVTSELPDDFRPPGTDVPANLKRALEQAAVQQLATPFPLFTWIEQHQAPAGLSRAATLTLKLARQAGITWRIYLTAEYRLFGDLNATPLSIGEPTLYADGEQYPFGDEIEAQTLLRGKKALAELLQVQLLDRWQSQFIGEVPIAHDVLHVSDMRKLLLLPILASELEAGDETRFKARLDTLLPNKPKQPGVFLLQPTGPENGDLAGGKLECMVTEFLFEGVKHDAYVAEVATVIAHRIPSSVQVRVAKYSRGQRPRVAITLDGAEASP